MTSPKTYTTDFAISKDGTQIGYRQLGNGVGLILVHGGMMASQNFMALAKELSNEFTVYVPDRRGRGLSEKNVRIYGLKAESEDLQALINKTGAEIIFGLSSGAIITLQAAIENSAIKKIALYEPPIAVHGTKPLSFVKKYESEISKGNYGKAFISIIKGTGDSSFFRILPKFLTAPLINIAIKSEAKKDEGDDVSLHKLIYAFQYDNKVVAESNNIIDKCKNMTTEVLLIGGQKSQPFLKIVLDILASSLKNFKRVELLGVGHIAADNGGKPKMVADELRKFFRANDKNKSTNR
nr:alpha/beta hydrolase [uncultured Fluviicola sp.]